MGHLISVITNHLVKDEAFVIYCFHDNQWKPYGLPTDRPTLAKEYTPSWHRKYNTSKYVGEINL